MFRREMEARQKKNSSNQIETILYHLIIIEEDEHEFAEITKAVKGTENID